MNQEIKKQWVAALRSGEFTQTRGLLRRTDKDIITEEYPAGHCCLGVLCELHARACGSKWDEESRYDGEFALLPSSVSFWAGLTRRNNIAEYSPTIAGKSLAELNDRGWTFEEIAEAIEENL